MSSAEEMVSKLLSNVLTRKQVTSTNKYLLENDVSIDFKI